jgi:hypothetical protein
MLTDEPSGWPEIRSRWPENPDMFGRRGGGTGWIGVLRESTVDGRVETARERWDRDGAHLMPEVRVAETGVRILFAFLLTNPFAARSV